MKKVSMSLFAVLAIVLGLASAFTTKEVTEDNGYHLYRVNDGTLPSVQSDDAWSVKFGTRLAFNASVPNDLTSFQSICDATPGKICIADIKVVGGSPESAAIEQYVLGDNAE